jgi:hypothetical protein
MLLDSQATAINQPNSTRDRDETTNGVDFDALLSDQPKDLRNYTEAKAFKQIVGQTVVLDRDLGNSPSVAAGQEFLEVALTSLRNGFIQLMPHSIVESLTLGGSKDADWLWEMRLPQA